MYFIIHIISCNSRYRQPTITYGVKIVLKGLSVKHFVEFKLDITENDTDSNFTFF